MEIKLVPVIEISNFNENIPLPDLGPFWKYEDEWESYSRLCNSTAGFSDNLRSYKKGSSLYKIDELSDSDLLLAIQKEIDIEETDGVISSFYGGYILEVDNIGIYFPQCCGTLADIKEWQNLMIGKTKLFFAGHPFPRITENENKIRFDFVDIEVKEKFVPPCPVDVLEVEKSDLENAIKEVNKVLNVFAKQLTEINKTEKLNIANIDRKVIWGEREF